MNAPKRILAIIDDRAEFEKASSLFSALPKGWEAHLSQTELEALSKLSAEEFQLLLVDLAAGPLVGAAFLNDIAAGYPDIIRIVAGATMDTDILVACVMGPHQFLQKPISSAAIANIINRTEVIQRLLADKHLQRLVSRIRIFPSQPKVYVEIMRELRSENSSAETVGDLIAQDLSISTKFLQVINSASFGISQYVATPADAVLLLGMEASASLILGVEAVGALDHSRPLYFGINQLWQHSQAVAQIARRIAEVIEPSVAQDAFTAGLLHDIGKLALAMNLQDDYRVALKVARETNRQIHQVERQLFGATHAEAGAYLLSLWDLPAPIIEAVAGHHLPASSLSPKFTALTALHLADVLEQSAHSAPFAETPLELDYPRELQLDRYRDDIHDIISAQSSGHTSIASRKKIVTGQ